jgi:hypothetical protein
MGVVLIELWATLPIITGNGRRDTPLGLIGWPVMHCNLLGCTVTYWAGYGRQVTGGHLCRSCFGMGHDLEIADRWGPSANFFLEHFPRVNFWGLNWGHGAITMCCVEQYCI